MKKYTDDIINFLREIAPGKTYKEIVEIFNKKLNSSYKYLHKFKDVINYLKNILQGLWLKVHARRRRRDPRKLI